jgi:hypothetical protein
MTRTTLRSPQTSGLRQAAFPDCLGGAPVIYGHYWRRWAPPGQPHQPAEGVDWTSDTACVDFSAVRNGPLVACRWSTGDTKISPDNYVAYR